jgi:hypothetical protein
MREEIRLGNEALSRNDIEAARKCFQQLLANGGTPTQERIATNRLREIQKQQDGLSKASTPKRRTRRKTSESSGDDATSRRTFVRPPEKPLVTIKRH